MDDHAPPNEPAAQPTARASADQVDLSRQVRSLKRRLSVVHKIDSIRDTFKPEDLDKMLHESMQYLASELEVSEAFVSYYDAYHSTRSLSVGPDGLIKRGNESIVGQLFEAIERGDIVDHEYLPGNILAVPMKPDHEPASFVGILGVSQNEEDACRLGDGLGGEESVVLEEASKVLDTAINNCCEAALAKDELELVREFDEINDEVVDDLPVCLHRMLKVVTEKLDWAPVLIFQHGLHTWEPLAASKHGKILWDVHSPMKLRMKQAVQHSELSLPKKTETTAHLVQLKPTKECEFAGQRLRSMVAQPMCTTSGEFVGTMVVASHQDLFAGHLRLIRRAASELATTILNHRNVQTIVKRYYKLVGNQAYRVLRESPRWLDPRQARVVILSGDLVGSTKYAHREGNSFKVFDHINTYLELMGDTIKEFNGTLDKYIGDEAMAIFGAPVPDGKELLNSVDCARSILKKVQAEGIRRDERQQPVFNVKITLGLVDCVVGEIGSRRTQMDYTVIGSDVNSVFRIATDAEPGSIICNEALYRELKDEYEFEDLGWGEYKEGKLRRYRLLQ